MIPLEELMENYKRYIAMYSNELIIPVKKHLKEIIQEYIKEIKYMLDTTFEYEDYQ